METTRLSKNKVFPSSTRSTVSGLSRGRSGMGNVALILNAYGVNFAGRYKGFGLAAAISVSVNAVMRFTENAPVRFLTSAAEIGSPSREWVDEPSLAKDNGRGAFNAVARSRASSSLRFVGDLERCGECDAHRIGVAREVIRPAIKFAAAITPQAFQRHEDKSALPAPVQSVDVRIQGMLRRKCSDVRVVQIRVESQPENG